MIEVMGMFDFKFDWDNSLCTGHATIDTQHRELFRIGREIEQLLITNCIDVKEKELLNIICELRDYVAYHFYEEERLMEIYEISSLEEHRLQHKKYENIVASFDVRKLGENPYKELKRMKDYITDLVFEHMVSVDKKMVVELNQKMKDREIVLNS